MSAGRKDAAMSVTGVMSAPSAGMTAATSGGAAGGAHSNTRWTTRAGALAAPAQVTKGASGGTVQERPQPFSAFGGYGAGELLDAVAQLEKQTLQQRLDELQAKQRETGLDEADKYELRALLQARATH